MSHGSLHRCRKARIFWTGEPFAMGFSPAARECQHPFCFHPVCRRQRHMDRRLRGQIQHRVRPKLVIPHPAKTPSFASPDKGRNAVKGIGIWVFQRQGAFDPYRQVSTDDAGCTGRIEEKPWGMGLQPREVRQGPIRMLRSGVHPSKMALDQMGHGICPIVFRI